MTRTTRRWTTAVAAVALAATMAACDDGEDIDDDTNAIDTAATQTTTSPPATDGAGESIAIATQEGLSYTKQTLEAPANTEITVEYTNDTNVPHNIHFYRGDDQQAPSIAQTEVVTGPDAVREVTFTTPDAGTYLFLCDVHPQEMRGELVVS